MQINAFVGYSEIITGPLKKSRTGAGVTPYNALTPTWTRAFI